MHLSVIIVSLFTICQIPFVFGGLDENRMCKGQPTKYTQKEHQQIIDCLDEIKEPNMPSIPPEKLPCFIKCCFVKKGFVNAEGRMNHDGLLTYIDKFMPDSIKDTLVQGSDQCLKDHGEAVDATTQDCSSFSGIGKCLFEVFTLECVE